MSKNNDLCSDLSVLAMLSLLKERAEAQAGGQLVLFHNPGGWKCFTGEHHLYAPNPHPQIRQALKECLFRNSDRFLPNESLVTGVLPVQLRPQPHQMSFVLVCPVCRFSYLHPVKVACTPAGSPMRDAVITHDGVEMKRCGVYGRGVRLDLYFEGECEHSFTTSFQFHKGETFVEQSTGTCKIGDIQTIWRD